MSKNIVVPKEVFEKFNEVNSQRKKKNQELLKYVAMDIDGNWRGHCEKPFNMGGQWNSNDSYLLSQPYCAPHWQNSLTEMPLEDI